MLCAGEGREPPSCHLKSSRTTQVSPQSSVHRGGKGSCSICLRHFCLCRISAHETGAPAAAATSSGTVAVQQRTTSAPSHEQLMCEMALRERELRQQLVRHEQEELMQVVGSVNKMWFPGVATLRDAGPVRAVREEAMWRRNIERDYNYLLSSVVQVLEVLHRRSVSFAQEPQCRKQIENAEGQDWIAARRRQVMRETQESAAAEKEDRAARLAYFEYLQQQQYQIFLLEERERDGRMGVERLQRLHAGTIVEEMAKDYRQARLCQLKYEAMRFELQPEVTRDLIADEALHRSRLCHDQALCFKKIRADEVRNYLGSARQELLNQRMEED
ncbi:hypothetical protein, conserved [Leishmania tarentolae]|uniref:Uncharacterized protein n=1 Tax=Leishmania tarentolae TaxID=5689 RepID=A0A640KDU7_LEITA|nr:hypothetical protein, conserved [Leishmania tarentolae]